MIRGFLRDEMGESTPTSTLPSQRLCQAGSNRIDDLQAEVGLVAVGDGRRGDASPLNVGEDQSPGRLAWSASAVPGQQAVGRARVEHQAQPVRGLPEERVLRRYAHRIGRDPKGFGIL